MANIIYWAIGLVPVIVKSGDDLRQELLAIQLIKQFQVRQV